MDPASPRDKKIQDKKMRASCPGRKQIIAGENNP